MFDDIAAFSCSTSAVVTREGYNAFQRAEAERRKAAKASYGGEWYVGYEYDEYGIVVPCDDEPAAFTIGLNDEGMRLYNEALEAQRKLKEFARIFADLVGG